MSRHNPRLVLVGLALAMSVSCRAMTVDNVSDSTTAHIVSASTTLVNMQVSGPLVTIDAEYSATAPADHMHPAFRAGVRMLADSWKHRQLIMVAGKSALPDILATLRSLSWISSIEVDSVGVRLQSETGPWGIVYTGAHVVDSISGNDGSGVKVGLIDSGVDCTNGDLYGRVAGGYDFQNDYASGCDATWYHGTAVAGIIAGTGSGPGITGMAHGVSLYSYVVSDELGNAPQGYITEAFDSAVAHGVKVINLSIADCGPGELSSTLNAITAAVNAGVIVVAAAGNGQFDCGANGDDSLVSQMARVSGVVAVSEFDTTLHYVTHGQYGSSIVLSGPEEVETDSLGSTGIKHSFTGTSAATPHVTGAIAMAIAGGYTGSSAVSFLTTYAHHGPGQTTKDNHYGYGQVDVRRLITALPVAFAVGWCTNGNITNNDQLTSHACTFTTTIHYGVPAYEVQYTVVRSYPFDSTVHAWGLPSQAVYIPNSGDSGYTMTVTATARDSFTQQVGTSVSTVSFYVCNITDEFILNGGGLPDLPAGCTPGGQMRPPPSTPTPRFLLRPLKVAAPAKPPARPRL